MRQRLAIAAALLAPRDLLILDEPTNGLDPQGTREVRHLVASLAGDGATVLVSSHLLSEVEQMCSHVGVMREGRLVAQGTVGEVRAAGAAAVVEVTTAQPELAAETLRALGLTGVVTTGSGASAPPGDVPPEQIVAALVAAGVGVRGFAVHGPEPGGPVRLPDRGGLRCQRLRPRGAGSGGGSPRDRRRRARRGTPCAEPPGDPRGPSVRRGGCCARRCA